MENGFPIRLERDLYSRKDQLGVEIRERAKWDIREAMVGADFFKPKHIVIATWKNVSFAGGIVSARRIVSSYNAYVYVLSSGFMAQFFKPLNIVWFVSFLLPSVSFRNIF